MNRNRPAPAQPGQFCIDTAQYTNRPGAGEEPHTLELRATLEGGRMVTSTNPELRIDNLAPTGSVTNPGRYLRDTIKITGTLADEHAGPRDWRLQARRVGGSWTDVCGPLAGPYECDWNTASTTGQTRDYPDGKYNLRAHLRDLVTEAGGGPNETDAEGAFTSVVDNTEPSVTLSGQLKDLAAAGPLDDGRYTLDIAAADGEGSGVKSIEVLVDGARKDYAEQACDDYACTMARQFTFVNDDYAEGQHTVRVIATDHVGFTSDQAFDLDVQNLPSVSLSGSLSEVADFPLEYGRTESLLTTATDAGSGVAEIDIVVDGVRRDGVAVACPGGACGLSHQHAFRPDDYSDGDHVVEVVARDEAGHEARATLPPVTVESPPPPDAEAIDAAREESGGAATSNGMLAHDISFPALGANNDATTADLLACTPTDEPLNFQAYSLGSTFEGLPLVAVLRQCDMPYPNEPMRANHASYIYGTCEIQVGHHSCAPPVAVQVWPACERYLTLYEEAPGVPMEYTPLEVRGVPAAYFGETRLEVYAGGSTIVLFGDDTAQLRRAADALEAVPRDQPLAAPERSNLLPGAATPLPEPVDGSLNGTLRCTEAFIEAIGE